MHVVHSLGTGGTEAGVRKLLAGLDRNTFEQTVCTVLDGPTIEPQTDTRVITLGRTPGKVGCLVADLTRIFARARPHIVHSRNWGAIEAVPAANLARIRGVIHSEHGLDIRTVRQQPWRRKVFRRFCFGLADRVFAVSQGLRDYYLRQLRIPADQMQVISNGVDTERFRPLPESRTELRQKLGLAEDLFVVGTVGRLDPVKDHRLLLRAAEAALSQGCPVQLIIVGDGPERVNVEGDVQANPLLRDRTLFAGEARNVAQWLNSFDVFVLPSLAEGMSNTLLEAMATGVAPVASRVGGNPEVIEEGRSGLLFEAGGVTALATHLKRLAENPKWRHELGTSARQRVQTCFSLKAMLENYTQLYESVLVNEEFTPPAFTAGLAAQHRHVSLEAVEAVRKIQ